MRKTFVYIFAVALATLFSVNASAQGRQKTAEEAIKTAKSVIYDEDGNVTGLRLETYVTGDGENSTTTVTTVNPTDIVLVLDRSASMTDKVGVECYYPYDYTSNNPYLGDGYWCKNSDGTYSELKKNNSKFTLNGQPYEGLVYKHVASKDANRMDVLKQAVSTFMDGVSKNADGDLIQVAVVEFGTGASVLLGGLTTKYDDLKIAVGKLSPSGTTEVHEAMKNAKSIITGIPSTRKSNKVVIFFTDGQPESAKGGFNDSYANSAMSSTNQMKKDGATIYSVGTFATAPTGDAMDFIQYVSSNYPSAVNMNNPGTKTADKYVKLASSAKELESIFQAISEEISSSDSKSDYDMQTSKVVLRDIITPEFQIPEGGKVTIKIDSLLSCTGEEPNRTYTWENKERVAEGVTYDTTVKDGKTYVDVKGFDFNNHWVGWIQTKKNGVVQKTEYHGLKLIVYIDIEPDPDCDGGVVPTNEPGSGIIIGDGYGDGSVTVPFDETTVQIYKKPDDVLLNKVNLIIRKSGLKPGESILYTVTRSGVPGDDFKPVTVVLTADASGNAEAKVRVDAFNHGIPYFYKVTEDPAWAWAYAPVNLDAKTLYDDSNTLVHIFDFGKATPIADKASVKRSEDGKNNVFAK